MIPGFDFVSARSVIVASVALLVAMGIAWTLVLPTMLGLIEDVFDRRRG